MSWPALAWSGVPVAPAGVMRRVDQEARARFGIEPRQLMEVAGFQVARVVDQWIGGAAGKRIAVVAGAGNNGGDALVAARFLAQRGGDVVAWMVEGHDPEGLAAIHGRTLRAMGIRCPASGETLELAADLVVDGLLGTGIHLPLRDPAPAYIAAINRAGAQVVAVDVPSGLDSESGAGDAAAVQADVTVTLGLPKPALAGARSCGRLLLADIGLPPAVFGADAAAVAAVYREGDLLELVRPNNP